MTEYVPDAWVIIRVADETETVYKVLGGWYGGYLNGDSWRLNSGITRIERDGELYLIHGYSGSVYRVHPDAQRTTMLMASVLAQFPQAEVVDVSIALEAFA